MSRTTRLLTVTALTASGLLLATAPGANAAVDPATLICVAETAADVTGLIDPASPAVPAEVPALHCLQP
ncbi:hypothetical protein [Nonomuraea typhae]|uniref:hypothetical protein n=1 Tax=Nonomuraea typhae TaxID=2603600 RepID=UPI0012F8E591|nr:hypothetical protein [Nonomuraea typhae]